MGRRWDPRQLGLVAGIVFLTVLIANALGFVFLTRPEMQRYQQLRDNTGPQADAFKERAGKVEALEGYIDGLKRAESDMLQLREDVLSTASKRMIEVQAELDDLTTKFRIPVEQVSTDTELLKTEELVRFGIEMPLIGNYADLRRFLQAVESSDKFLTVEKISLGQAAGSKTGLELDISMATYFQATPEMLERLKGPETRVAQARGGR